MYVRCKLKDPAHTVMPTLAVLVLDADESGMLFKDQNYIRLVTAGLSLGCWRVETVASAGGGVLCFSFILRTRAITLL